MTQGVWPVLQLFVRILSECCQASRGPVVPHGRRYLKLGRVYSDRAAPPHQPVLAALVLPGYDIFIYDISRSIVEKCKNTMYLIVSFQTFRLA